MDEHIPVKTSVKRRRYPKAFKARSDVFYYIEIFYNRKRKHGSNHLLSPVEFENRYQQRLESVYRFGGDLIIFIAHDTSGYHGEVGIYWCRCPLSCIQENRRFYG